MLASSFMAEEQALAGAEENARPWWMTLGAAICLATVIVSVVRDLAFEANRFVEVWFGFEVTGPVAMLTAPIHWAIFATGAWAFWTRQTWIANAAVAYLFYGALAHLVWSEASPHGRGILVGCVQAAGILSIALLLHRAHRSQAER